MARIEIRLADPKKALPRGVIRIPCKVCKDSTLHNRIVHDRFNKQWRKAEKHIPLSRGAFGFKATWKCEGCGNVQKF